MALTQPAATEPVSEIAASDTPKPIDTVVTISIDTLKPIDQLERAMRDVERVYMLAVLDLNEWKIIKSSKHMGISRRTLLRKMHAHGIRRRTRRSAACTCCAQAHPGPLIEWDRFQVALPALIESPHRGRWVVFLNGRVESDHDNEDDAFEAAVAKHGLDKNFIIAQVATQNPALILFSQNHTAPRTT
jgi:DNA-binding protein Fis